MYPNTSVVTLCKLFGKTRQGWYAHWQRKKELALSETFILKLVKEIRREHPRIGTHKIHYMITPQLQQHGIRYGRDKLYHLLYRHGLLIRQRKRKVYTTNSNHSLKKYPNLIKDLRLYLSEQLWVSDITYLKVGKGFAYLSLVTDAYSRKIVGWCLYPTLEATGAVTALTMAIKDRKTNRNLIHHSDRGIQYCCQQYARELDYYGIRISMSAKGDPYENAIAERVNGILKTEYLLDKTFNSIMVAKTAVANAIEKYNYLRPHASCDYNTPDIAHQLKGPLKKRWKSNKKQPCTDQKEVQQKQVITNT
ncbi:MAG: IS3 family transposase [Bacteroidota bacterium]